MGELGKIAENAENNRNALENAVDAPVEAKYEETRNEDMTEDSNASLMSIPSPALSPLLASILAVQDDGHGGTNLEQLSEATMGLLPDTSVLNWFHHDHRPGQLICWRPC